MDALENTTTVTVDPALPLRPDRREQFALLLASGTTQTAAYRATYDKISGKGSARSNASHIATNPIVRARVQHIREHALTRYDAIMTRESIQDFLSTVADASVTVPEGGKPPTFTERIKAVQLLASIGGYYAPTQSQSFSLSATVDATAQQTDFAKRLAAAKQIKGEGGKREGGVVVTPLAHTGDQNIDSALGPESESVSDESDPSPSANKVDSSRESPLDPEAGHGL